MIFFFYSFSIIPILFWQEIKPEWCFWIFWIFILFFWNFLNRVGLERTRNQICFSLIHGLLLLIQARNKVGMMFSNFLNFYTIFLKISKLGWVGTDSERKFLFSFSTFLVPFWVEIKLEWCFLIFWIFYYFFWTFLDRVGLERTRNENFLLLIHGLARPIQARNKVGMMFLIFWIFILFFGNFLNRVG